MPTSDEAMKKVQEYFPHFNGEQARGLGDLYTGVADRTGASLDTIVSEAVKMWNEKNS